MKILTESTDTERAAGRLREAAARLGREAELLDSIGGTLAANAPRNAGLRAMLVQADQLDAITMLLEGGDTLEAAVREVMVRGWTPEAVEAA